MTAKFKKGDVVQLNSGGPWMTVEEVEGDEVSCTWFDKDNALQTKDFDAEILRSRENSPTVIIGSKPKRNNYW